MRNKAVIAVIILAIIAFSVLMGAREILFPRAAREPAPRLQEAVGIIHLEGTISAGRGGLFAAGEGDRVLEQLRKAADDPIKALVVRINSPGGSAAASQEIYQELLRVREKGKVVVVSMADVAASGGYMIACAADSIVASPGSVTGSIGVILDASNVQELYELMGIEYDVVKGGEHKDILSPARPLEDGERQLLQEMVDDIYEQFIDVVAEGRELEREEVSALADGRIFSGRQAKEAGLVDEMGNLYDAVQLAAEKAGIEREPYLHRYDTRSVWSPFPFGGDFDLRSLLSSFVEEPISLR